MSFWFTSNRTHLHVYHVKQWEHYRRRRWWVIWKMKRTGGKTKTSRDVRHRMRHALEIGPRRNNLSYPHTLPPTPPKSVSGERIDAGKKRERDSGNWVMSIAIYRSTLFPASGAAAASPIVNVTNVGDIFCYIITIPSSFQWSSAKSITYCCTAFNLLFRMLFKKFILKWKVKIRNAIGIQNGLRLYFSYFLLLKFRYNFYFMDITFILY